jgi:hypothetical protein
MHTNTKGHDMRTKDLFPSKYLSSADVKAKQIVATISHMKQETVGQGADQKLKPVLFHRGQLGGHSFGYFHHAIAKRRSVPGLAAATT